MGARRCRSCRAPSPDRRPSASRRLGCTPPGSPRSAPSPPSGAARGSRGSRTLGASEECAVPPCPRASASHARGSRCAAPAARRSSRCSRRRSGRQSPTPSAARQQSRSSRAGGRRPGPSPPGHEGSSSRRSSGILRSGVALATQPYRRPPMTTPSTYTTNRDATVADGVELRVQPALSAANAAGQSPFLSRLAAVRCAFRCVASIISRDGGPASAARAAKMRSNTPADEAVVERLVRAIGGRRIAPPEALAEHVDGAAQHAAIIHPCNPVRPREVRG